MPISVQAFRDECSAPLRLRLLAGERGMGRGITGSRVQEAGLALAGEVFPVPGRVRPGLGRDRGGLLPQAGSGEAAGDRRTVLRRPPAVRRCRRTAPGAGSLRRSGGAGFRAPVRVRPPRGRFSRRGGPPPLPTLHGNGHGPRRPPRGHRCGGSPLGTKRDRQERMRPRPRPSGGHRFVADDMIHVDKLRPGHPRWPRGRSHLPAHGDPGARDHQHPGPVRRDRDDADEKMELVIRIEWDPSREYDRLGLDDGDRRDPRRPTSLPSRPGLPPGGTWRRSWRWRCGTIC